LEDLTAHACATLTGRQEAAVPLHSIDAAGLFLVALDEKRTSTALPAPGTPGVAR